MIEDKMQWIECENDYSLSGSKNFKLTVKNGTYSVFYLRPMNIYSSDN